MSRQGSRHALEHRKARRRSRCARSTFFGGTAEPVVAVDEWRRGGFRSTKEQVNVRGRVLCRTEPWKEEPGESHAQSRGSAPPNLLVEILTASRCNAGDLDGAFE